MSVAGFLQLAWQSVVTPREVARWLLSLRLGTEALLLSGALALVLNTLFVRAAALQVAPDPAIAAFVEQPLIFFGGLVGMLALGTLALTWAGRAIGGTGQMRDVALLLIWLQALRALVQALMLVLMPILPALALLVSFGAGLIGIWLLINFLAEAHGFASRGKAAFLLLIAVAGLAVGLSFLFSLFGATATGMNANV